jgi:endoglucanase
MSSRREFLKTAGLRTAALATVGTGALASKGLSAAPKNPIPRWRGFHVNMFRPPQPAGSGVQPKTPGAAPKMPPINLEEDFRLISDFGFDFVRLPVQYWNWVDYTDKTPRGGPLAKDLLKIKESGLVPIDNVIELARKYKLHASLDMVRAPGFNFREAALGQDNEPFSLWRDKEAQDAFVFYWDMFAKRYRGISSKELSFDLLNEPQMRSALPPRPNNDLTRARYQKVMTMATEKIRETSPDRIILVEGLDKIATADDIVPELIPLGVAQSMHGYAPGQLTHYRTWIDVGKDFALPTWPLKQSDGSTFGLDELEKLYEPWGWLVSQGIGVHCGEFGVSSSTPHDVALRFMHDQLDIWKRYGIGWTYLSLHGGFTGVTDSNRPDVAYEDFHGYKLDRKLLTLLQYH